MSLGKAQPEIIVVSSVNRFRALARSIPQASDTVLEIGCSTGGTTRNLVKTGARIYGIDSGRAFAEQLRAELKEVDHVSIHHLDGRSLVELTELVDSPDVIFIDIGGDARLDGIALQLRFCLLVYRPRIIVIRNFELAWITSLTTLTEPPDQTIDCIPLITGSDDMELEALLELSHAISANNRIFAARKLMRMDHPAARQRVEELRKDTDIRVRRTIERVAHR